MNFHWNFHNMNNNQYLKEQFYYDGTHHYRVDKLVKEAKNINPVEVNIDTLFESINLDLKDVWDEISDMEGFVDHCKRVMEADLSYPIILIKDTNEVCDGCHRIVKAKILNKKTILAKYIEKSAIEKHKS